MAKELAHFKNFAKLEDTSVEFNDITVLAGKPGTGKSYVMKFIYSVHEALIKLINDSNFILDKRADIKTQTNTLLQEAELQGLIEKLKNIDQKKVGEIREALNLSTKLLDLKKELDEIDKVTALYQNISEENLTAKAIENILRAIFNDLTQISNDFSVDYFNQNIKNENDSLVIKSQETPFVITHNVFVETPLILEFKKFMKREEGKTPYHIESLLNVLDTDYSFTDEEQDKFIKSFREKSQGIIQGDIESSGDSFIFNRIDEKNYDILNASSGIKSIGLLQYLVTNKALKKGSILFWEEPEVHLHPEWQLRMVELFVELMNAGIKIVFSTHSPYMCDYLNAISQKNSFDDRVSFNLFDETDGVVENHILNDENWNKIQAELLDPLEEIMWEYI